MKDHDGMFRGFFHLSEAWYGEANLARCTDTLVDDVNFGFYSRGGGTSGEMAMRWMKLGDEACPRIEAYSDAWDLFDSMSDVFAALAALEDISPKEFCELLLSLGFEDLTPRTNPHAPAFRRRTK